MVAILCPGRYLRQAFHYNENKVKEGVAEILHAENYPGDIHSVSAFERLHMLEKMAAINPRVRVNSLHVSLNFDPSEQLPRDKMMIIAKEYMEGLGFGNQPYLVYQHHDSGHPHLHILTTNVQLDGTPISFHHLANRKSEPIRKALEKKHALVIAEGRRQRPFELKSAYTHRAKYGKTETKRAIGLVLKGVLDSYKYASLPELNAVLQLYNVRADRGSEDSRIHRNRGLVYRILDDDGKPVGVPVKASLFYSKPTLSELERRFRKNEMERRNRKSATRNIIDSVMRKHPGAGLNSVVGQLARQGVDTVLRQNKEGVIYGFTYVNHRTGCVFNGSSLGREYSAKRMLERCGPAGDGKKVSGHPHEITPPLDRSKTPENSLDRTSGIPGDPLRIIAGRTPLEVLTDAEQTSGYVPYDLRKRRKKKRRGLSK